MRPLLMVLMVFLFAFLPTYRADAQLPEWELLQNDPNPFCGMTMIGFQVPQTAEVILSVLSPDSSMVVRTLVEGVLSAGFYTLVWDQADEEGIIVSSGVYPYHMGARSPELKGILFDSWQAATVTCEVPIVRESWGRVKSRYCF